MDTIFSFWKTTSKASFSGGFFVFRGLWLGSQFPTPLVSYQAITLCKLDQINERAGIQLQ
jgi:hypothetical protein